ncbi:hypothetical protein BamMEX5DRAFT_6834 [Burkholderia ambifaria MEX-5]|uniref:Uncharacterized protein n=2 Tax=Burkholderia ambifaria TaxID=152480 RepID=B1TGB8_9BURK|nr:hypothetical protein BamMEX5DRAFT_6834 [Burkholderia ambifaria MEX-5]
MNPRTKKVQRARIASSGPVVIGRRSNIPQTLQPPRVEPSFLAPLRGAQPDNLLLAARKDEDLPILLPFFVEMGPGDTYQLLFGTDPNNLATYGAVEDVAGYAPGDELEVVIDPQDRPGDPNQNVTYYFSYRFHFGAADTDEDYTPPASFIVDLVSPGDPSPINVREPIIEQDIIDSGLTDDSLTQLGDEVPAFIATYGRQAQGDRVWLIVNNERSLLPTDIVLNIPTRVAYLRELIERATDGPQREFRYQLEDRAGNLSHESQPVRIDVRLAPVIGNLIKPKVPVFEQNGIIKYADAAVSPGLLVEIPGHTEVHGGDTIVVKWGGTKLPGVSVPAGYNGENPMFGPNGGIAVPYDVVRDELPQGNPRGLIEVTYEVLNGDVSRGISPPEENVLVDLNLAGGEDPTPLDPVHGNLLPLTIRSMDSAAPPNVIPAGLTDQNATAVIPWKNKNNEVVFKKDDIVRVFWDGTMALTQEHTIDDADMAANDDLELTVEGSVIDDAGTGDIAASYEVSRPLVAPPPDQFNPRSSPDQSVDVRNAADLPGGGNPLPKGEFINRDTSNSAYPEGVINAVEGRNGTPFQIPVYPKKAIGDVIHLEVQGYKRTADTPTGNLFEYDHEVIDPSEITQPYDFRVDEGLFFLPDFYNLYGRAKSIYWVTSDKTTGKGVQSLEDAVTIDTRGQNP